MNTTERLKAHLDAPDASHHLHDHVTSGSFVRARFDTLGGRGDDARVADRFTADDLAAVSALGSGVAGPAAVALLDTDRKALRKLLRAIPRKQALHKASDDDLAAVGELEAALGGIAGLGPTTRTKLLARKRPTLVPLADPSVAQELTGRRSPSLTVPLRDALQADGMVDRCKQVRSDAGVDDLPLLRVIDIVVWMRLGGAAEADTA